jgi:hypothetical protein
MNGFIVPPCSVAASTSERCDIQHVNSAAAGRNLFDTILQFSDESRMLEQAAFNNFQR